MTDGSKLSAFIRDLLGTIQLTLAQEADMTTCNGGTFEPEDIEIAMIDVQILHAEGNVGELIKLYKRLPQPRPKSNALAEYLEVEPTEAMRVMTNISQIGTKEWRLNNLYKIIDKKHQLVTFTMNNAQKRLFELRGDYPRIVILKSRQRGISTFALLDALDECLSKPNKIRGLQADTLLSSNALMEKVKLAYDKLPDEVKPSIVYANNSEISFTNGSKIRIATSFRGATLSSLHVSELAKIALDRSKSAELISGTFPAIPKNAESSIVLESTSEGSGNIFYSIFTEADTATAGVSNFYPMFIGWLGIIEDGKLIPNTSDEDCSLAIPVDEAGNEVYGKCPAKLQTYLMKLQRHFNITLDDGQIEWAMSAYKELDYDLEEFLREYPATVNDAWASNNNGKILAESYRDATNDPDLDWDDRYPKYAAMDLGVSDTAVVLGFQYINNRIVIVREYANTGQGIAHYIAVVETWGIDGKLFLPHDSSHRGMATAQKLTTHIRQLGFRNYKVLKRTDSVWNDIAHVRAFMSYISFGDVEGLTGAVQAYSRVWSAQLGEYLDKPLHDLNSHYCDALRYVVRGVETHLTRR